MNLTPAAASAGLNRLRFMQALREAELCAFRAPADTRVDATVAGDVHAVLQRWYTSWDWVAKEPADASHGDMTPDTYHAAPEAEIEHRMALRVEKATLMRVLAQDSSIDARTFVSSADWIAGAVTLSATHCFPCLISYTGHERVAQTFVQRLIVDSGPIQHPLGQQTSDKAYGIIRAIGDMRTLIEDTAFMAKVQRQLLITLVSPYPTPPGPRGVFRMPITPHDVSRFMALLATCGGATTTPAVSAAAAEIVAAMIASRLLREYVVDRGFTLIRDLAAPLRRPADAKPRARALIKEHRETLARDHRLLHDDSDASIRILALTLPENTDPTVVWHQALRLFHTASRAFCRDVHDLITAFKRDWTILDDRELITRVREIKTFQSELKLRIANVFPSDTSLAASRPSDLQRQWRLMPGVIRWWHYSTEAASVCGCDTNCHAFLDCMCGYLMRYATKL